MPIQNRLIGATFDAAGNVTAWPADTTYEWDGAGSMHALHAPGRNVVYLYTADDERVASVARVQDANFVTRNRTTWTLRGPSNQLLRTWVDDSTSGTRTWNWSEDEIWRGSTLLATESLTGTRHVFTDHLGSPRFMTDSAGHPAYAGCPDPKRIRDYGRTGHFWMHGGDVSGSTGRVDMTQYPDDLLAQVDR